MDRETAMKKLLVIILFVCIFFPAVAIAQLDSSSLAHSVVVPRDSQAGDIICAGGEAFKRCDQAYSTEIYGVVVDNPALALEAQDLEGSRLVATSGKALVRISAISGNISVGSLITTSENPGVGQLVTRNGYVLGIAEENFEPTNPEDAGKILVTINIHPATGTAGTSTNLISLVRTGALLPFLEPVDALRYLLALIVVLLSFGLGFIYFGRIARSGIEAIGRNPLAARLIQLSIVFNVVIAITIIIGGLIIAYLILVL